MNRQWLRGWCGSLALAWVTLGTIGCHDDRPRESGARDGDSVAVRLARQGAGPAASTAAPADGLLYAYFFDVGQGDATLLRGPDFTILVDAGRHARSDVVPHLISAGVEQIDLLVGTHPHADHIGQFPEVLRSFPVTEVWMSGDEHTSRTFERAVDAILASGAGYHEPRVGEVIRVGSARVEVLNPAEVNGDFHDGCVAMRVVYGDMAFMLMGDVEVPGERRMLAAGLPLTAQVLKLGHHGSSTSTSRELLSEVRPEIAIYSAGEGNSYGHPHDEVIRRVRSAGVPVYGTDQDGTILLITDGTHFEVETRHDPRTSQWSAGPGGISLNSAPKELLVRIAHISPERAERLIEIRPIRSLEELTQIEGIGPARLEDIKRQGVARLE